MRNPQPAQFVGQSVQSRRDVVLSEEYMEEKNKSNADLGSTQFFRIQPEQVNGVQKILSVVYEALSEKGYDPVNQIVGYIMSGDPTYVTNYKGARSLIMKVERDELVEEIMRSYIQANHWAD
jgi:uncharacterized protein (UPF0297 family)